MRLIVLLASLTVFLLPISAIAADLKLVVVGDSLSAGYQLAPADAFPSQLQKALDERGHSVEVVNAGVSGDTTSGGLSRLDWSVGTDVDAVILQLGANDALRGISPDITRQNIFEMTKRLRERNVEVLLAGMIAPRNLGPEYAEVFDPIYQQAAETHGASLYPFFLDGVALEQDLNLSDGMHPNAKGVSVMVERILPFVEDLLKKASSS